MLKPECEIDHNGFSIMQNTENRLYYKIQNIEYERSNIFILFDELI